MQNLYDNNQNLNIYIKKGNKSETIMTAHMLPFAPHIPFFVPRIT